MKKFTEGTNDGKAASVGNLDELIQQGAREVIQQAIEAELATLLEQYGNVSTLDGRRAAVRNGYLPEREVVTAIGPVAVGAEGTRPLRLRREVQFEHCAAIHPQVTTCVGGVAVALSARRIDRQHE